MKAWFQGCESCGRLHARVTRLCLECELQRETAMANHPSVVSRVREHATPPPRRGAA